MSRYYILEGNFERLAKKLTTIANKCKKYGCEFSFDTVGEQFSEITLDDGQIITAKYIIVDVEGVAKVNGWRFIATVEHTPNGNIIHPYSTDDIQVPTKYHTTDPICEHCNTKRRRNDTFLVYNEETGEWKQVGKSCLKDFTGGLDAEWVARYISYFDEIIKGEAVHSGGYYIPYYPVIDVLKYAAECVKHFGYHKAYSDRPTGERCLEYYLFDTGRLRGERCYLDRIKQEMADCHFCPDNAVDLVEAAIQYTLNETSDSDYIHNLKVLCKSTHITRRNLNLLVSLIPTYYRHIEREAEIIKQAKEAEECVSQHIGNIGDKVEFDATVECITSVDTEYGVSFLYKFVDTVGNIFIWFTSKWIDVTCSYHVKGTVKEHSEFRCCKQTKLTRCRLQEVSI